MHESHCTVTDQVTGGENRHELVFKVLLMILTLDVRNKHTLLNNVWICWIISEILGLWSHLIFSFVIYSRKNWNPKKRKLRMVFIWTFIQLQWYIEPLILYHEHHLSSTLPFLVCVIFFILIRHSSYQSLFWYYLNVFFKFFA